MTPDQNASSNYNEDDLRELVKRNLRKSTQELVLDTNTFQFPVCDKLKRKKKKKSKQVGYLDSSKKEE